MEKILKDEELSLLGDDITKKLVKAHLGLDTDTRLLSVLGLIDGNRNLTETGWKIASVSPLFGDGKRKRRKYPSLVFAFLLASSLSLPSPVSDSPFFRKEGWTSLFPDMDPKTVSKMSWLIAKAMESRSLFAREGSIDIRRSQAFMSLSLHDRLSYVISSLTGKDTEIASKELYIIESINGLKTEDLKRVTPAPGNDAESDIALFFDLGILYEEDGCYTSCSLEENDEGPYTLSSDFTITYPGTRDRDIYLIADPVSTDTNTTRWVITKDSIKRAFDLSLTTNDILEILSSYSSYDVGDGIKGQIESWEREYNQVRIIRGTVVVVEERFSSLFTLPGIREYVIEKLSDKAFLLDSGSVKEWTKALSKYGVSMLGSIKGPSFTESNSSSRIFDTCFPLKTERRIPDSRRIPFNREKYSKLLESAPGPFERILLKTHLAFSLKEAELYDSADGLDYNSKKTLVTEALKNDECIIVLYADDRAEVLNPVSIEGDILETEEGTRLISRFWRVSSAPKGIIS
jgi:hypothetical protein